jgi:hypothetical protein
VPACRGAGRVSPALRAGVPGWPPRRYGLAATILAADGVTAGSPAVRADRTDNPDSLGSAAPAPVHRPGVRPAPIGGASHR